MTDDRHSFICVWRYDHLAHRDADVGLNQNFNRPTLINKIMNKELKILRESLAACKRLKRTLMGSLQREKNTRNKRWLIIQFDELQTRLTGIEGKIRKLEKNA